MLKDSLCLLDPEFPKLSQLLRILSGSFALLFYAIDFWLDHVLVCASIARLPEESSLGQALTSLELLHNQLCTILRPNASSKANLSTLVPTDRRLDALSHLSVHSLCTSLLAFRADCQDKSASNGEGKFIVFLQGPVLFKLTPEYDTSKDAWADYYSPEFEGLTLEQDSTLFSTLSVRFRESVSQLLSESFTSNGISRDQLDRFRKQYLQSSFRCRFAPCTRASLGFPSETLRASHEQLHLKRLFCDKPNCSRGRIGFRNQKDLDVHERTYHEEGSILVPPRVRKAFNAPTVTNEQLAISNDGELRSQDEENRSAVLSIRQQGVVKYKTLLPFNANRIKETLSKWKALRSHQESFAVLLNEKFKSSLDVNLMYTLNHDGLISCVDISPDDHLVATGCNDLARVFDIRTGEEKYTFEMIIEHTAKDTYVAAVRFTGDGHHLAVASRDGRLTVS